jgi:hypothetical protein
MTVIEISPHKWGWRVFEAPSVEPVFPQKDQAIGYAETRACSGRVKFAFWIRAASSNARLRSMSRIGSCDVQVRVSEIVRKPRARPRVHL